MGGGTEAAAGSQIGTFIGLGACFGSIVVLFNLWVLFGFMREKPGKDGPSPMSMGLWGASMITVLLGPCAWPLAALVFLLARSEQLKIYNEESSIRSTTPVQIAAMNAATAMLIYGLFFVVLITSLL